MTRSIIRSWFLCVCFACLFSSSLVGAQTLGSKPSYLWGGLSSVPNQQSIDTTIWAPGLEDGYVPQGLTHVSPDLILVSAYRSTDTKVDKGSCRVFSVSTLTGDAKGYFDMPDDCGHAGGLAVIGSDVVVVSDTRTLYKVDLPKALVARRADSALLSVVRLEGKLKGSFVDFDGTDLWIGSSEKDASKAMAHRLSMSVFDEFNGQPAIRESVAQSSIPIPVLANGMAFDSQGRMWLSTSNSKHGALYRLDARTGTVEEKYDMVIGLEDLGFAPDGRLWAVSEAGTRRWIRWFQTYPVIFRMNVSELR